MLFIDLLYTFLPVIVILWACRVLRLLKNKQRWKTNKPLCKLTNRTLKDFVLPFPMETMHGWTTAGSLRSKNIKRTHLQSKPCARKDRFERTCQAKVEHASSLNTASVMSQGRALRTTGRACRCFETRAPLFWTSPLPDMCSLRRTMTSQQQFWDQYSFFWHYVL